MRREYVDDVTVTACDCDCDDAAAADTDTDTDTDMQLSSGNVVHSVIWIRQILPRILC
jgi:hypothetical protein